MSSDVSSYVAHEYNETLKHIAHQDRVARAEEAEKQREFEREERAKDRAAWRTDNSFRGPG